MLGRLKVGEGEPVRVAAAINLSPESFFKGSVAGSPAKAAEAAARAVAHGAEILDLGAMSTAPYLKTEVSKEVEAARMRDAVSAVVDRVGAGAVVSVDTVRSSVAETALRMGASVVNDVTGLKYDAAMAGVIKDRGASLIAMARSKTVPRSARPVAEVRRALKESLGIAERAGIDEERIVTDPGIGFFREDGAGVAYSPQSSMPWYRWDVEVIAGLGKVAALGRPVCIGVSRKSFLGKLSPSEGPEDRLPASLGATAVAVMNGASVVRTHDVKETVQTVRVVEATIRRADRLS